MIQFLKRSFKLAKIGRAAIQVRRSSENETRDRARHYLVELMGQSRGLPAKVGQFLSLNDDSNELSETLSQAVEPLHFSEIEEILNRAFDGNYRSVFKSVEKKGFPASLGQVHQGRLRNGRQVAIKVRYPEIKAGVESELKLLGWLPGMGPVKKWGFAWDEYVDTFHSSFSKELDYTLEAQQQIHYHQLASGIPGLVIPEALTEYSSSNILVQSWEGGQSFEQVLGWTADQRRKCGDILLRHYLLMLFQHGVVHSDPNPGNFAFRLRGDSPEVIVYDFGSVFELTENERKGLLRTIVAAQRREAVDPAACLAGLGFDVEKLRDLRPQLAALLSLLFEPFLDDRPYDPSEWNLQERVEAITGELKWWFRSAAPPRLIFLIRTLNGMVRHLVRLNVRLSWKRILQEVAGEEMRLSQSWPLPTLEQDESTPNFQGLAQYLKVRVKKASGRVDLTMPARVVDSLEEVIDPAVLETIRKNHIDLAKIQRQVQTSGYRPQTLFDVKDEIREVQVWLE